MIVPESVMVQILLENDPLVLPRKRCEFSFYTLMTFMFLIGYLLGFLTLFLIDYYTTKK
jgi:hypothetical protein